MNGLGKRIRVRYSNSSKQREGRTENERKGRGDNRLGSMSVVVRELVLDLVEEGLLLVVRRGPLLPSVASLSGRKQAREMRGQREQEKAEAGPRRPERRDSTNLRTAKVLLLSAETSSSLLAVPCGSSALEPSRASSRSPKSSTAAVMTSRTSEVALQPEN